MKRIRVTNHFADNLFHLRMRHKWSAAKVASMIGLTQHTSILLYENGKCEPTISMALKIAEIFNLTLEQLILKPQNKCNQQNSNNSDSKK